MHACVAFNGELKFDPHRPDGSGQGLVKPERWGMFLPVVAGQRTEAVDAGLLKGKRLNTAAEKLYEKHDEIDWNLERREWMHQNGPARTAYAATHRDIVALVAEVERLLARAVLDDDPAYWRAKLETAKTALKRSEASAKAGDWKMALSWQEGAFTMAHGLLDRMRRSGARDSEPAPPYAPGDLIKLPSGRVATVTKCLLGENLFREKEWHVSTRTGEIVAVPVRGGARDIEPVDVGDDFTPHRFEPMPGNRKNQPCNRCLEFKAHPNHDLTAEREPLRKQTFDALPEPVDEDEDAGWVYTCITKDGARHEIEALTAKHANAIAEKRYGYANIAVSPQESLKRRATDAESPHTRENLEAYIRRCEARLKETASPWMKAEVRKGIELAKKELAAMGTARDARRARVHRALDAVMDGVTSRRGLSYDHPRILAIRAKIAALEARGVKYDDPRIQKFEADIRQLEGNR